MAEGERYCSWTEKTTPCNRMSVWGGACKRNQPAVCSQVTGTELPVSMEMAATGCTCTPTSLHWGVCTKRTGPFCRGVEEARMCLHAQRSPAPVLLGRPGRGHEAAHRSRWLIQGRQSVGPLSSSSTPGLETPEPQVGDL